MIYLLRHGETEWNREGRLQGHLDSPLTERGRAQARAMGCCLRQVIGDLNGYAMVTSPLGRARETAEEVAAIIGYPQAGIAEEAALKEHGFGDWQGERQADLPKIYPEAWQAREADRWSFQVPGGESYALVALRLRDWLARQDETARLIAVSHGLAGRILRGLYQKAVPAEIFAMNEPQDAIFRLSEGVITRFDAGLEADA